MQRSIARFCEFGRTWRDAMEMSPETAPDYRFISLFIMSLRPNRAAEQDSLVQVGAMVANFAVDGLSEMRQHSCPFSTSILFWAKNVDRQPVIVHNVHLIGVPTMRITTTLAAAAAIAVTGAAASAGGLAPEVMEAPVVVVDTPMAPAGSINSGYVVLGLLAALVAASGSY